MPNGWYFADKNRQVVRPLTLEELKETLATYPSPGDVLVWRDGLPGWKPAKDVLEPNGQTPLPPPLPSDTLARFGLSKTKNGDTRSAEAELREGRASGAHNVEKLLRTSQRKFPAKTVLRFCILVAIVWYLSTFFGRDATAPVPVKNDIRSAAPTEVLRLTAQEISTAYENNEVATDNWLKGTRHRNYGSCPGDKKRACGTQCISTFNKKRVYAYDDPSKLWRRSKNRCTSGRTVRRVSLSKDEPMGWITDRGRLCPDEWLLTQEITGNFHGSRPIEQ